MKTTSKQGLDQQLFRDWRYNDSGRPKPDFVLNQPELKGAQVLLAGDNFGCGSSREHAPWALTQFGFRAVIGTSFADIFRQNALKNSLLPVVAPAAAHADLLASLAARKLTLPGGRAIEFPVDPFAKHCLLNGVDELGYIQQHELRRVCEIRRPRNTLLLQPPQQNLWVDSGSGSPKL